MESLKSFAPIAIGTPNRIRRLIEYGALSLKNCVAFAVDVTLDQKENCILTAPETQNDIYSLLEEVFRLSTQTESLKISLFKTS